MQGMCLSGDGLTVGGTVDRLPCLWTEAGVKKLTLPEGFTWGQVKGLSKDGSVAVGLVENGELDSVSIHEITKIEVCEWKEGIPRLICPSSLWFPVAISSDGSTVVGDCLRSANASSNPDPEQKSEAFRWREDTGVARLLAPHPDKQTTHAEGCSADGSVVVGSVYGKERPGSNHFRSPTILGTACFWSSSGNCTELSVDGDPGMSGSVAQQCSPDGRTIIGQGRFCYFLKWVSDDGGPDLHFRTIHVVPPELKVLTRRPPRLMPNLITWVTIGVAQGFPNPYPKGMINDDPIPAFQPLPLQLGSTGPARGSLLDLCHLR